MALCRSGHRDILQPNEQLICLLSLPLTAVRYRFAPMLDALLEWIARFLVEFAFYTVLYGIGWLMLKSLTLGQYPPAPPVRHNKELVALFPVASLFLGLTFAYS